MAEADLKEHEGKNYALRIGCERAKNDFDLIISIRSKMHDPLILRKDVLPWSSSYNITVVAATLDGTPLARTYPIDDAFDSTRITLKYGESITGRISLGRLFPAIPGVLKKRDVIVFWSYQLFAENKVSPERLGGWLIIPKLR